MQPKTDSNEIMALYFITFVFIGSFFIINLFVGIIVDSFSKEKEKLGETTDYFLSKLPNLA